MPIEFLIGLQHKFQESDHPYIKNKLPSTKQTKLQLKNKYLNNSKKKTANQNL